ncbi:MAG: hypothetical protein RL376_1948 [Verrucomicrobiota bacterium]|jgi:hypothetical protein
MKSDQNKDEEWTCGGWSDHEKLRRELAQGMSFPERLRWLEGATKTGRLLRDARVVEPPAFARLKPK